jgi:hypothetical protein
VNAYKKNQRDLNIWVGEKHGTPQGNVHFVHKSIPRDKRKMSYRINIFKRIITHINIQIQASNHTR